VNWNSSAPEPPVRTLVPAPPKSSSFPSPPNDNLPTEKTSTYEFKKYDDGTTYFGEFKDEVKHGQGTMTSLSGSRYVGEWTGDKKNGHGTFTWANGTKYVGESIFCFKRMGHKK
jgi:hypothetical protein